MRAAPLSAPWITVAVPVYNVEPYLRQCVESVLVAADEGVELLLVDDASTDGSAALLKRLADEAGPRLRWLQQTVNQGVGAARNRLIEEARGEWLWFLDGDDWIAPAALPRLKALLAAAPALDAVYFDYAVQRSRPRLKYRLRGEHHRPGLSGPPGCVRPGGAPLLRDLLATGNLFVWTFVARRALWQGAEPLRFPAGCSFEDMATAPRLALRARSAWHEGAPWVMYRRRDDSLTGQMSAQKVLDLSRSLLGFRAELLRLDPGAGEATRAAVAHQAARNLIAAQRHALRLPAEQAAPLLQRCRADFLATIGDDLPLLQRHYLRRGWWWRAWKLRRALA